MPEPSLFKEAHGAGGEGGSKRGRGRPRKYADQQSQIMFMSEGASTPMSTGGPMDLGTPMAGEKRERSPDYDDDDGSDYDGTQPRIAPLLTGVTDVNYSTYRR
jgi:hypothetical protein